MNDVENIVEYYYEKLADSTNPGPLLARFMGEMLSRPINKSHIIMMNKFIKNYGRFLVFFSIIDLADVKELGENIYPMLNAICKRRFEKSHAQSVIVQYEKLDREVNRIDAEVERMKKAKIKFPSSDDL